MSACLVGYDFFFFFKQKTAYEIMPSLVGSEMCIRDRALGYPAKPFEKRSFADIKPERIATKIIK